jgi:hypothetical protein
MVALVSTASSSNVSCCLREEKREKKKKRWLAGPKWWAAQAFGLGCNAKEIMGRFDFYFAPSNIYLRFLGGNKFFQGKFHT